MDWEAFYNSFRTPDFIPGFEIENRLGGGAFGDVYKARRSSIGKAYAIKFLKVESDDQRAAVERELDQVRHLATIDHPNLVSIEDLGIVMGVPYIVMGFAGDETLAKRLRAGDLTAGEALRVFTQTARGVLALHDRNMVHFDLKPSNVFLHGDAARVGDYGLSKLLDTGRMTLSIGRGTPMYMAPEILRSRADHRADVYSLGVILYESLAGRVPFAPDDIGGLVLRDSDDPPVFPPDFPAVARPAVEACLRLDPKDRAQTVAEVLYELGQSARPGDSVTFDLAPDVLGRRVEARPPERPREAPPEPDARPAPTPVPGVARSLLDGGIRVEGRPGGSGVGSSGVGGSVVGGSAVGGWGEGGAGDAATPAARALALVAELRAQKDAEGGGAGRTAGVASVIPVPPRVEGGALRTVLETVRVGFDVFVASIAGVVTSIVGSFRWTADTLVRDADGGLVARAARFALFVLLMGGVGFGATLLGLFVLFLTSASR